MGDMMGGIGVLALGLGSLALWIASRRSSAVWNRNVRAFSGFAGQRFAWGFAGGAVFVAMGLIVQGGASLFVTIVDSWPGAPDPLHALVDGALGLFLYAPLLHFVGFGVSLAGRPRFLYPPHAFDNAHPTGRAPQ